MGAFARAVQRLVEPIWLGEAMRRAASLPPERAPRVRELGAAARRRATAAKALRHDEHDVGALCLEREAAVLAIGALATRAGIHDGRVPSPAEARNLLEKLAGELGPVPSGTEDVRDLLLGEEPLGIDAASPTRTRALRVKSSRWLGWLLDSIEVRTLRDLRFTRAARTLLTALVLVGGLPLALWWIFTPPNLAVHHPVALSSVRPGSAPPASLTNGARDAGKPVITLEQDSPWARVDLLDPCSVSLVVVHAPANAPANMLPLVLELSDDDRTFSEVATRAEPIDARWRVSLDGRKARFVRVRHPGRGALALGEIEVFGRK